MELANLPTLLAIAWLLPLASFALIVFFGPRMGKAGRLAGHVATAAILTSCVISLVALLGIWLPTHGGVTPHEVHDEAAATEHASAAHDATSAEGAHHASSTEHGNRKPAITGDWYTLGEFGSLRITVGYYIDALTVLMFAMVTFIATCIHFYAIGYMHDELHDVTDHEVTLSDGHHLHRKGRFHRFFQYLSLFCFSMLGLVIAGNIAMVFVFWELVGICSYFLIGFYIERRSASTAANKAFIVNRVGDFGMIVGLMAILTGCGTFSFGNWKDAQGNVQPGIFEQVRPAKRHHALIAPDGMVRNAAHEQIAEIATTMRDEAAARRTIDSRVPTWRNDFTPGSPGRTAYWLLVIAGLGIFCGCVGKSAQFPLHVWLPDAMEGPTPVSALVHSATMVAAGVYLVGRFYPVFTPEVLLVIAVIGTITLFIAATIAITAVDIKRVLAYSTVSQLGYMMLSLGVGGWSAGMFHLITHAFFKSLLFMCSGSVIHATHTNDMTRMGGLRKKMPWTAYTMLVGCLAIMGAGVPFSIGLSGYYSKDAILAQALNFEATNPKIYGWVFFVAAAGAAITAFYMFRLWFMTFAGDPRDRHAYEHAHESPRVMYVPLVILAVFAVVVGWSTAELRLTDKDYGVQALLEQARPAGTDVATVGRLVPDLSYPSEHESHAEQFHTTATIVAFTTALTGFLVAVIFYGVRWLDPREVVAQFRPVYQFLIHKWYFDELYHALFVAPALFIARRIADFDKKVIDRFIDGCARWTRLLSQLDDLFDRYIVDALVNWFARWTYSVGSAMRTAQTGNVRQYVMFIVIGTVALFVLISFFFNPALGSP